MPGAGVEVDGRGRHEPLATGWQSVDRLRSFSTPEHDLRGDAGRITAPTLIVWGGRGIAIPKSAGRTAHRLIKDSGWAVLPTGHVVFSSARQEFLDTVTPFLDEVAACSPRRP